MQISERVQQMAASQSLAMSARARQMREQGIDVISMSVGEPDMDTPEHIRRAGQEAIENGFSHYGPIAGLASLREAIAAAQNAQVTEYKNTQNTACADINIEKKNAESTVADRDLRVTTNQPAREQAPVQEACEFRTAGTGPQSPQDSLQKCANASENVKNNEQGITFDACDVIVSVGAKMAIYNAIQTAINPGDEVIIPMPSWVSYGEMVKIAGGVVVPVMTKRENRYCMTAEQLREALTPKTRMLILCSPNNPTGSVYSYEELKAIVEVLREWPEVVVLSDEIYNALVYSDEENKNTQNTAYADINIEKKNTHSTSENDKNIVCSMAFFPEIADRLIIVNGVSKAYAMTGYRIGWMMTKDRAFLAACTRLQGQELTCATMVAQKAAEAALRGDQECVAQMRETFAERRELICRLAAEIPGFLFDKPEGAFYLFPDVTALFGKKGIANADALTEYLLENAHVAVVSGSAFGCPDCIRLSYAISTDEITEAMRRIKKAVERLG